MSENAAIGTTLASWRQPPTLTQQPTRSRIPWSAVTVAGSRSTAVRCRDGRWCINRETDGPTRNITVRATSADGSFTDQAYTITINDVDEFDVGSVSDTDATTNAVSENAAIGTTVGVTASASDADATTNAITYSLVSSDGGRFTINSSTGIVTVAGASTAKPMDQLETSLFGPLQPMDRSLIRLTRSQSTMSMSSTWSSKRHRRNIQTQ